jgi:hypothetical protein
MRARGAKMVLSGAAQNANKAAGAGYFADSSRKSPDRWTRWRREWNRTLRQLSKPAVKLHFDDIFNMNITRRHRRDLLDRQPESQHWYRELQSRRFKE